MAKQIQVVITDDIDGGEAHETIAFGLDGSSLEIDLNKLNAAQFRKTVAPYIEYNAVAFSVVRGVQALLRRRRCVRGRCRSGGLRGAARRWGRICWWGSCGYAL